MSDMTVREKAMDEDKSTSNAAHGMDRRAFVKGALATGAIAAVAATVGCAKETEGSSRGSGEDKTESKLGTPSKTLKADVCVVGVGGGSGMACALEAAEQGLKVIGLEKMVATNGAIAFSEGMTAIQSKYQKAKGVTTTVEEATLRALIYHHWIPNHDLYTNWLKRTASTIDWLEAHGVMFEEVIPLGESLDCWHLYAGDRKKGAGFQMMKDFAAALEKTDAQVLLKTSGKELVIENGKVAGVLAVTDDGEVIKIEAPVVHLATGGYSNNKDMIRELGGVDPATTLASGSLGRDGDGIKMALSAGGKYAKSPGCIMFYGPILWGSVWGSELQCATSTQPCLWVNELGERFTNEELAVVNFTHAGNAQANQKRMFNVQTEEDMLFWQNVGPFMSLGVHTPPGVPMPDVMKELEEALDGGNKFIYKADTIEELAKKMGVDAATFKATVDEYNVCVDKKSDTVMGKSSAFLRPLKTGPFYAFECANGYFTTCGGIKVTPNCEVVNEKDEPIPGLYAGGVDAGGLFGDTYDVGILAGSMASWAVNSGRIVAEQAREYLGKA